MILMSGYQYNASAGETWDSVALAVYGDEARAAELLGANPQLCALAVFRGGEAVLLPVIDGGGDGADYAPARAPWKEAAT